MACMTSRTELTFRALGPIHSGGTKLRSDKAQRRRAVGKKKELFKKAWGGKRAGSARLILHRT